MSRVTLRAPRADDADLLFRIAADLDTWEERSPGPPAPLLRSPWEERVRRRDESGAVRFVVDVDGVAAGRASLFDEDPLARHAEVGIALAPEARGSGVGTAAIGELMRFAFVRRNLRRLHLEAIASNAAALRSYEKAGFVVEGRLVEHAWVRGGYEDVVLMGALRSRWTVARSET